MNDWDGTRTLICVFQSTQAMKDELREEAKDLRDIQTDITSDIMPLLVCQHNTKDTSQNLNFNWMWHHYHIHWTSINHKVFLIFFESVWFTMISTSLSSLQLELNSTVKNLSVVASQITVSKH